jgi:hypothetical protein
MMALHDEEQRQLAEIERRLAEDDPRLARRLATLRPMESLVVVAAVVGVLASVAGGLIAMVFGVVLSSPILIIAGVLIAVFLPTAIAWRVWRRHRR